MRTDPKIYYSAAPSLPFRNLLSVLNSGIKYEHGASKDMKPLEVIVILKVESFKEFDGG